MYRLYLLKRAFNSTATMPCFSVILALGALRIPGVLGILGPDMRRLCRDLRFGAFSRINTGYGYWSWWRGSFGFCRTHALRSVFPGSNRTSTRSCHDWRYILATGSCTLWVNLLCWRRGNLALSGFSPVHDVHPRVEMKILARKAVMDAGHQLLDLIHRHPVSLEQLERHPLEHLQGVSLLILSNSAFPRIRGPGLVRGQNDSAFCQPGHPHNSTGRRAYVPLDYVHESRIEQPAVL